MEDEGEEEGGEGISLLGAGGTRYSSAAEEEMGRGGVAGFRPRRRFGAVVADGRQHRLAADAVEGVLEVQKKDPFLFRLDAVVEEYRVGGVNDGFSAAPDADADLMRREVRRCVGGCLFGDALGGPPADRLTNCYRTVAARFLCSGEKVAATQIWGDVDGRFSGGEEIYEARHRS